MIRSCGGTDSLEPANALRGLALWHEQHDQPEQPLSLWQELQVSYKRLGIQDGVQEAGQHMVVLSSSRTDG